jgi:hypothetical protein
MGDYCDLSLDSKKGDWSLIEEDISYIEETVREYFPGFPEIGVYSSDDYDGENPVISGAWHDEGDVYFTSAPGKSDGFPEHSSSIHEMGHAVGWYIQESMMPSFSEVFIKLDEEELEHLNSLNKEEKDVMDEYGEVRAELNSGHFAAAFEHAFRNSLELSTDNIEGEKRYADAEDNCENSGRDYFWDEQDEYSMQTFLQTAVREAEQKREEFFELIPNQKEEKISYSEPEKILGPA